MTAPPLDGSPTSPYPIIPIIGGGEMGRRVRETDWSTTPLGDYTTWPQSLRTSLSLVLNAKGIAALYWGPDQWLLYNDAYGVALGDRHPEAFGRPMPEVLFDIAPMLGPQVAEVLRTGEGFAIENLPMTMHRHGRNEAAVWTYSFSPIQGETGGFAGVLLLATVLTEQKTAEVSDRSATTRLETALRVARLGTFDWHPSTGIIEVDARGREMFGLPAEGVLTQHDTFGNIAREHVERVQRDAASVMGIDQPFDPSNLGRTIDLEYDVEHPDGTRRSIVSSGTIVENDDGTRRMIGSFNDVTEMRRAEARLLAQNATLEQRVEERTAERDRVWRFSRDMLGVADDRGVWVSVNPAWTATLGWQPEEIVGRTSEWMEHPDDVAKTRSEVRSLAAGNVTFDFENRFRTRDGDYRTLNWTATQDGGRLYCVARDVTAERAQGASLRLFQDILESASAPICAFDTEFQLIAFNRAHDDEFFRVQGFRTKVGDVFPDLFIPEQRPVMQALMARALTGETFTTTQEFGNPEIGKPCWELTYSPLRDETGRVVGAFHYAQDISDRLRAQAELEGMQEALRQSQKMEAVGQLTGGLAHDFNNLLAGISGSLEMIQARTRQGRYQETERYLLAAQSGAKRAASLTHRLLAFSRRQTLDPKPTDVNRLVGEMQELVQRTVGPGISTEVVGASGLWSALVDASQLENALLNLCINARDAMPDGGRITIETANRWLDERAARQRDLSEGQYLSVSVTDTGSGMSAELVEKVFEPFFTTKPIGEGTGLGLSMVYGFARQSGGQVRIYSEVGTGTSVCLYLPRHYGDVPKEKERSDPASPTRASQGKTVLVVEDEPLVRMLVTDTLDDLGYAAIEAGDSAAGLKILQSDVRIDLLVSDVGLPGGMNGRQMADAGRLVRPDLKVLFVTGYAENAVVGNGHMMPGMAVITKPFEMDVLAARIRSMVES